MTKEQTCIIISSRISDIKEADEIIVLDDGKIVERGKHEELIMQEGQYYGFYEQQISKTKV